jgi:polyhydroxyalkanoate synthesis regulator protein
MRDALAGAFSANPFADIARRNMELFKAASGAPAAAKPRSARDEELEQLRAQLAELQAKVDKLSS